MRRKMTYGFMSFSFTHMHTFPLSDCMSLVCVCEWAEMFHIWNHIPPLFLLHLLSGSVIIYVVRGRTREGRKGCAFHVCEYIRNARTYTHTHPVAACNKHMRTCHTTRSLPPRTNKKVFFFPCAPKCLSYMFTLTQNSSRKKKNTTVWMCAWLW